MEGCEFVNIYVDNRGLRLFRNNFVLLLEEERGQNITEN